MPGYGSVGCPASAVASWVEYAVSNCSSFRVSPRLFAQGLSTAAMPASQLMRVP